MAIKHTETGDGVNSSITLDVSDERLRPFFFVRNPDAIHDLVLRLGNGQATTISIASNVYRRDSLDVTFTEALVNGVDYVLDMKWDWEL